MRNISLSELKYKIITAEFDGYLEFSKHRIFEVSTSDEKMLNFKCL